MLKKLNSWKDKLIDILNVSYKISRRFMASFSVRMFSILSLVCLTLTFSIILIGKQIPLLSKAAPNEDLLATYMGQSDFVYYRLINDDEYRFYFTDKIRNNDGTINATNGVQETKTCTNGSIIFYDDLTAVFCGTIDGSEISKADFNSTNGHYTNIIAGSVKGVTLTGDFSMAFCENNNLIEFDGSNMNTSQVTKMANMFYLTEYLVKCDVTNFDTSNVTDMNGMFYDCRSLTEIDLSNFDTSKVTDMNGMFTSCRALTELDLSNFDTSKVTNMKEMFKNYKGHELDVSNFDTSSVTDMESMFAGCDCLRALDLSNFNTSSVTTMKEMFKDCTSMLGLDLSSFDTANVRNFDSMFNDCYSMLYLDISSWVIDGSASAAYLFTFDEKIEVLKAPKNNIKDVSMYRSLTSRDGSSSYEKLPITSGDSITIYKLKGGQADNVLLYHDNTYKYYNDETITNIDGTAASSSDISFVQKFNLSSNGSCTIFGYLYSNGLLILDGTGSVSSYKDGDKMLYLNLGTTNRNKVLKIVASYDGFSITNSYDDIASYFCHLEKLREFYGARMSFPNTTSLEQFFAFSFDPDYEHGIVDMRGMKFGKATELISMFLNCKASIYNLSRVPFASDTYYDIEISSLFNGARNNIELIDMSYMPTGNKIKKFSLYITSSVDKLNLRGTTLGESYPYIDVEYCLDKAKYIGEIILPYKGNDCYIKLPSGLYNSYKNDGSPCGTGVLTYLPFADDEGYNHGEYVVKGTPYLCCYEASEVTSERYKNIYYTTTGAFSVEVDYGSSTIDDHSITLEQIYDISESGNGSLLAYLYSDGMLVLDGTGNIKTYTTNADELLLGIPEVPWNADGNMTSIKYIAGSDNGFTPTGNMQYLFCGASNLIKVVNNKINTSNVASFAALFMGCTKLTNNTISIANATNTREMFSGCTSLTSFSCSNACSNLKDASFMFNECSNLGSVTLGWICTLDECKSMFYGCSNLSSMNLTSYRSTPPYGYCCQITLNTDDISYMFTGTKLTTVDFSQFTSLKPIKKIAGAAGYSSTTTTINLAGLDLSSATNANITDPDERYFYVEKWNVPYYKDTDKIQTIILPSDVPTGSDALYLPAISGKGWQGYASDGTTKVGGIYTTLPKARTGTGEDGLYQLKVVDDVLYTDGDGVKYYRTSTSNPSITLSNSFDLTNTSGTHSSPAGSLMAYLYSNGLMIFDGEGDVDTSKPYRNIPSVVNAVSEIVMSNYGFKPCGELDYCFGEMQNVTTIDLTNIDTQNVTSFYRMFYNDTSLTTIIGISDLDTRNLKYIYDMFRNCYALAGTLDLHHDSTRPYVWDVSHVMDSGSSKEACLVDIFSKLGKDGDGVDLNLSGWNFNSSSWIRIQDSFEYAKLTNLDISGWENTNRLSNIYGAFHQCIYLGDTLDLSSLHLTDSDMSNGSFSGAFLSFAATSNLKTIILPSELNADAIINLPYASNTDGAWAGYKADGITKVGGTLNKLTAARTGTGEDGLYQIKFVNDTLRELDKIGTNGEPDSSLGKIKYKTTGTNDPSVTLIASYDLSDTANGETAGSICAYIYSDGTMIFDGEGAVTTYTDIDKVPWRDDKNINDVIRIVMSNNGFKPYGSIAGFFSPLSYTPYMQKLNNGKRADGIDADYTKIQSIDLTGFDSSEVTNMHGLFYNCSTLNEQIIGIENLNTSKVTDMSYMFQYLSLRHSSTIYNGDDASGNPTYIGGNNDDFIILDLSEHTDSVTGEKYWDVSNVTNFNGMFHSAFVKETKLKDWTLNTILPDSSPRPDGSITFSGFTYACHSVDGFDVSGWKNTEKINPTLMFNYLYGTLLTKVDHLDFSSWNLSVDCDRIFGTEIRVNSIILPDEEVFTSGSKIKLLNPSSDRHSVWVACNQNGDRVKGLNPIRCEDYLISKYDADHDGSYTGPNDIYKLQYVSDVLYRAKNLDADGNIDNSAELINYFRNGTNNPSVTLATYDDDDDPNTPEVPCVWDISTAKNGTINAYLYTNGMMIFDGEGETIIYFDTTLSTYTPKIPWANTNNEVRKRVKRVVGSNNKFKPNGRLSFYFCYMDNLNTFDGTNFDATDITYLSNAFSYSGIKKCIIKNWNTNKVISTSSMFSCSNKLTELDMTGCTFNSLYDTSFMFYNASSISSIDLSDWNTTLTDITYMFDGTSSLTDLNLGNNITINTSNISKVFCNTGLSEPLFKGFKEYLQPISNLEGACGINFANDTKYSTIDLSKLDLSNVASPTSIDDANTKYFYTTKAYVDSQKDTSKIKTIILPSKVPNIAGGGCELYIPHIDGYVWNGYASDGITRASDGGVTYKSLPAMSSSSNLSMIKLEKEILYTDSNSIDYYRDSTSDTSDSPITRVKVYDLTNTSGTRGDSANTVRAYLYSNGLMIFDGEGDINAYTNKEDVPWRKDSNLHTITKVVGSNNGFIPHGSMAYYFDMACDTTYYVKDSGNVNVSDNRVIDNFTCIDFTKIDTSNVTSFKNMFYTCDKLNQLINVEYLITSNVSDMSNMFGYTDSLQTLDLSAHTDNTDPLHPITYWDVSNVTDFSSMFLKGFKSLSGSKLSLNNWVLNPSSDINAFQMFNLIEASTLNINNWSNTNKLSNVGRMFNNTEIETLDLSGFELTNPNLTGGNDMIESVFFTNKVILPDDIKAGFNIPISARTHESWLGYNGNTKISDDPYYTVVKKGTVAGLDNIRRVTDILHTDSNNVKYYRDGTSDNTITLATYDHDGDAGTAEIQCIWDLSKNNDNSIRAYLYTNGLLILDGTGEITEYTYYTYNNIPWRVYQKEHLITKVVGSNRGFKPIGSMAYLFFMNKYTDGTGYLDNECLNTVDFTNIDTSEVTSFEYLFYYCEHLSNIIGISNLDTHNVTSMQAMFNLCESLTSLDLHHDSARPNVWDVSNVTKFSSMFSNLGSNTNNVNINLSGWTLNSSNDIIANYMFQYSHIDNINLTGTTFTNKLKNIETMFLHTCLVNPLDLSKFDLTNPSLIYSDNTLNIDVNNLNTYTNTIILPESDKLLAGANLKLPTKTDYAWFGYDSSGNRLSEKTYTTLPKQGDDPNLYQIKLEGSALFTIEGKKYYATDLLYKWDVSEIGDEGNIYAYAFKDNAGNVTVVFDDVSTDGNNHYMISFDYYEGINHLIVTDGASPLSTSEILSRNLFRSAGNNTYSPWSILNKFASDFSLNGVTEFKFNTAIHFKDTKYLFAGTNVSEIEIDDNYLFELSDSTNHYNHIGMFLGLNDPFSIKFTSDIPYLSFNFATAMDSESRSNTIDFSGITITNYPEQYVPIYDQYLLVDNSFGIIYLPEHLIGFDNDLYKERIEFIDVIGSDNNSCKWFEVYNDNDSIDTSDDIFLGYTDTLIDTNCTLYKDNLGNTIYPSYIKHLSVEDEFALHYIELYNQYIEGKYLFGQDRIDELTKSSPDLSLILDLVFSTLQMEEYYSDTALGPMLGLATSLEKLFDDSSFNGLFKSSDLRTEFKNYYNVCVSGSHDNVDLNVESLVNDLFEFIKDDREDLGLSPKISYSSYENKFTYDNDTNELGYFKKVSNKFISELFNKELISDNSLTISSYGDTIKLYVSNILGDVYKLFININDEKDASDNLVFNENHTTPVYDDTNDRYVYSFDLLDVGKFTFKALNKYFTAFNVSPTMKDDGLGNEIDNEYTVTVNTNKIDLSSSNINVTVSNVSPQLLADPPVQIEPDITVTYTNNVGVPIVLEEDTDYTVSYGANNSSGTNAGTIIITGNNTNTSGSRTIYFDINDSFIKLKLSDLQLGTYGSLDENEIVKYKDGTNNRNPEDITTFGASELHPFIIYNDGTSDIPIYLEYTNAFISDISGNPIFAAGENESTSPKTKRNIKFEGLKLSDSDSTVYKLFEDNLTTEISSSNSNDNLVYLNASYLLDKDEPTVSAISKDASVTSPLSYNDDLILNIEFNEELNNPIDKDKVKLIYQIGNLIDDTNFKLTIKDDTDIVYSDSDHKTIIKFTGKIPSDIGLIVDSPIKIKSLLTDDVLYDIAGNELDRDVVNKFTDNILVNTLEDYTKNLIDDIDIFDPDVTNSDIEKAMIAYEKLSPSDKDAINGSNYVNVLNKKYYGDDSDRTTYPGLVVPGEKDVTNIDGNDNESVEVFGTVSALEDKYSYKIILRVDKITDSNEIKDIETKLKNKVSLYKQDEENLSSYRIKLVDSNTGNEVEPDITDKILVRLEVPYEVFSKINALYHILDDDSVETLLPLEKGKYNVFDGTNYVDKYYIYFEINSFSSFTLTMLTGIIPSPDPDPSPAPDPKPISTQTITVQTIKNNSYIDGYSDGTFKPEDNITRGEFSKILASISNNYSDSNKLDYSRYINSYKDVSTNDWYSSYIGFNNKKQVMIGYNDMTFKPNKAITRAEAAKALTNMYNITANNNSSNNISDTNTFNRELNGKWYENSMKKLINAGLLKGYPDGTIRPNDPITRAEIVALINRITNRDVTNNFIKNANIKVSDVSKDKWYYNDIVSAMLDY